MTAQTFRVTITELSVQHYEVEATSAQQARQLAYEHHIEVGGTELGDHVTPDGYDCEERTVEVTQDGVVIPTEHEDEQDEPTTADPNTRARRRCIATHPDLSPAETPCRECVEATK
jgi:hypothetical protein